MLSSKLYCTSFYKTKESAEAEGSSSGEGLPDSHKALSSSLSTRQGGKVKKKEKFKERREMMPQGVLGDSWLFVTCLSLLTTISYRQVHFSCPNLKVLLDWGFSSYRQRQWARLEEETKSKVH